MPSKKWRTFCRTLMCESAFLKLKAELLIQFDPCLPMDETRDASPIGVTAILSHNLQNFGRSFPLCNSN